MPEAIYTLQSTPKLYKPYKRYEHFFWTASVIANKVKQSIPRSDILSSHCERSVAIQKNHWTASVIANGVKQSAPRSDGMDVIARDTVPK